LNENAVSSVAQHIDRPSPLTMAEAVSASVVAFSAFTIFGGYFTDWTGLTISPAATFIVSAVLSAIWFLWLGSAASRTWTDLCVFTAIVAAVAASLLWWQWPDLLLPGGGADLAHHLQLVEYIDRHWRLVHDPPIEAYLGEMVHYTPGAHLLASLIGRWTGTDGFHAIYACSQFRGAQGWPGLSHRTAKRRRIVAFRRAGARPAAASHRILLRVVHALLVRPAGRL
jgi:hypothetical protein